MTGPELPERLEELIAGYVLGNLSSEEAEELRQVLTERPELSTEVHRLQEVLELMPYALPEVAPPQHLREAILAQVAPPQHLRTGILTAADVEVKRSPTPKRFPLVWSQIAGSIAALLVLALGLDNYQLRQQLSNMQAQVARQKDVIAMLQNPNTHLVSLKGMDMASAASGSVVMTPGEPKAVLILQNLPVLPKGQAYQLWVVVSGEKIPSGQFNPSSQGTVFVKMSTPPSAKVTALVVTVEVSPAPRSPDGPMVMTSSL